MSCGRKKISKGIRIYRQTVTHFEPSCNKCNKFVSSYLNNLEAACATGNEGNSTALFLLLFGWYRYRKKLVPEKSTGTGTWKIWYRKNFVPVPENSQELPVIVYFDIFMYLYALGKGNVPEKSTGNDIGKNWSRYRRIPGNSRSLYIFISSCTFRHWEKEMSLLGKPSPKKTILLMKVYVSSPEKMFMFWGHELMMVSCLQQVSSKEIWGMWKHIFGT